MWGGNDIVIDRFSPSRICGIWGEYRRNSDQVADLGYGAPVEYFGEGSSERKKGRKAGTIETGLTIDFRQSSYANCVKFMKETMTGSGATGSEVYALVVKGVG